MGACDPEPDAGEHGRDGEGQREHDGNGTSGAGHRLLTSIIWAARVFCVFFAS
jgi:hypothetical protein